MNNLILLTPVDLLIATILVVAAGLVSVAMRLGIEKRLALSALRTVVQLGLVGLILERVFALRQPILIMAILAVMILFAGREASNRSSRAYRGMRWDSLLAMGALAIFRRRKSR